MLPTGDPSAPSLGPPQLCRTYLELRYLCHRVQRIDGQAVCRRLLEMERHKQNSLLGRVGNARHRLDFASSGTDVDLLPIADTQLLAVFGADLDIRPRLFAI